MTIEDDIAFLERIPVLRRLGAPALRILTIGAEGYRVEPGQVLFMAGDVADGAFVVQRGSFTLRPESGGEADIVAGPGTLLGESALLAETTRPATATAREDFDGAAHPARNVPQNARRLPGRRVSAPRNDRGARRSMGA